MGSATTAATLVLLVVIVVALVGLVVVLLLRNRAANSSVDEALLAERQAEIERHRAERKGLEEQFRLERSGLEEQLRAQREQFESELRQQRELVEADARQQRETTEAEVRALRSAADEYGRDIRLKAERAGVEADRKREAAEAHLVQERHELRQLRWQLERREERLGERERRQDADQEVLDARHQQQLQRADQLDADKAAAETLNHKARDELQRVAGLTRDQARDEVMAEAEHQARLEATQMVRDIERDAKRDAEVTAAKIITTAIQRLASEQTSESVVSTVDLPSDEMKGRIIGREGRNIRAFEQVTGVNVMIDDTPESVLLSSFDPVRREIARVTLVDLVADGRIHPARIEEAFQRNTERIQTRIIRAAEDALAEVGISDLNPELLPILGSLRYRTSYGQNVLKHLIECGHIAGMMAAELGLDVATCKRAAFLHDIGKAVTHEVEGTHAVVGAELARRHGEHPDIVHAIEAHHNEVEPRTVEAILTQAADAISGSRPGARRESLEAYVHRLERLEQIAAAHPGVEKVFAMQAGREVRVMVSPGEIDDTAAHALAREIAREVQTELTYPGQIRITVVRESRASEFAH